MDRFEYKVVPAPARGEKARGLKSTGERFAHAVAQVMNHLAADGWEYLRADTLPCVERSGLTGRMTAFHHLLVFRRPVASAADQRPVAALVPARIAAPVARTGETIWAEDATATPKLGPAQRAGDAGQGNNVAAE